MSPRIVLGFDFGTRRIGVAVGQGLTRSASALVTLSNRNGAPDWEAIGRLIEQWQPAALVVGLPLNLDGSDHEITRLARRFGNRLRGRYNLPVYTMDERLSSAAAEALLAEQGRYDKADVDKVAAQLILQGWLEQQSTEIPT
jgi:putative Holliday junction resolvase